MENYDPSLKLVVRSRWCRPNEVAPKYPGAYIVRLAAKPDLPNNKGRWDGWKWRLVGKPDLEITAPFEWLMCQWGWCDVQGNSWPVRK